MPQTKTRVLFAQLDTIKMMQQIPQLVSPVVEMDFELGLKSAMTITRLMEMVVSQIAQELRVAGYEMEEAQQTRTFALSVLQDTTKTIPLTPQFV